MSGVQFRAAVLAALLTFASPLGAHEAAATSAQRAILPASVRGPAAIVDAFHAALGRGDTRSAAALLADGALIFEEGGVERGKAEYVAHHLPVDAAFSQVVASNVTQRAGGSTGTLAWVASEGRMRGTYKGKALDRTTTETMLLRRGGGAWKIIHIHWSSGAAP